MVFIFSIVFKIGLRYDNKEQDLIFLAVFSYLELILYNYLRKYSIFLSEEVISFFFNQCSFLIPSFLLRSNGLTDFQNVLLSVIYFYALRDASDLSVRRFLRNC